MPEHNASESNSPLPPLPHLQEGTLGVEKVHVARDLIALAKPRITFFVVFTMAGGFWLAKLAGGEGASSVPVSFATMLLGLLGTSLIVAGANALNMYIERDIDKHMVRTQNRPLPAGRIKPQLALWFGVITSAISVPMLALGVNATTALLAVLANLSYVLAYTPLKQRSHYALWVGAVPGAIPPLLGWTSVTGRIDPAGIVLFLILFFWQIPHFLAITLFRREDYAKAGLIVMPNVRSESEVRHTMVRYAAALLGASVLLYPLGVAGRFYLIGAFVLGALFIGGGLYGLMKNQKPGWAKGMFAYSLIYLLALFAVLGLDVVMKHGS